MRTRWIRHAAAGWWSRCLAWTLAALTCAVGSAAQAQGLPADLARQFAGGNDDKVEAIRGVAAWGSGQRDDLALEVLQAMSEGRLRVGAEGALLGFTTADGWVDALTRARSAAEPAGTSTVSLNNRLRRELSEARATLELFASEPRVRLRAAQELTSRVTPELLALLERALADEQDERVRSALERTRAAAQLRSPQPQVRLEAVRALSGSGDPQVRAMLTTLTARSGDTWNEPDAAVRAAAAEAIKAIDARLKRGELFGEIFTGLSLGSVLLLAALGLAISYGLMGVINMAHGELIMIGAYATYLTQLAFRQWLPAWFDAYIVLAIPVSFLVTALVGAALERSVIRFLYGRPLETLLATWGISLVLMQGVRTLFGAQNVRVESPSWLNGGVQVLSNLTLPYARIAIILFAIAVVAAVAWLIARTRLGLFVRGVTQNRTMAACTGVNTARVDTYAFALGAGIAGLAGCALSQIGNVGPDLGQRYIVDSFMVVVLGGVGQLAGTVYAALGLGIVSKFLEGWQGAVLAKIMVLVLIIAVIQKRPQGLFALRGRSAEA